MRVLTVRQPWAWAIIHGGKDVENRSRNVAGDYRGPVAIHAGLQWDGTADTRFAPPLLKLTMDAHRHEITDDAFPCGVFGAIIGVVDLLGAHDGPHGDPSPFRAVHSCFQPGKPYGLCSEWAEKDAWHLVLANAQPLMEPIALKGGLGLRRLDDAVERQVLETVRA